MRLCRAGAEVDKLAEALREQSRIRAPDMKNKLLAEGSKIQGQSDGQSDGVRKRLCRAIQSPPLQLTPLSGKGGLSQVDAGKETSDSDI